MGKKRRHAWPKQKFLTTGPKLKSSDIRDYDAQLTDGACDLLSWQNGGIPNLDSFVFDYDDAKNTLARVRWFYGINLEASESIADIARTIVHRWHDLPRGCIPIGDVDIEGLDFEICTLVTFLWGDRAEKVYFFDHPHDIGPLDPDDSTRLTLLAKTLPAFVKSLRCYEDYAFREIFQLSCDRDGLSELENALCAGGLEEFHGDEIDSRKPSINRYAFWPDNSTNIYLSQGTKEMYWVPLPDGAEAGKCYLGINLTKWNRTKILSQLKSKLRGVAEWKGAKSLDVLLHLLHHIGANSDEPCVGPKHRMARLPMETTWAVLGQRRRYPIENRMTSLLQHCTQAL